MRFVHQNLWQGCVGAWCPSQDNSRSTLLTDFSPYRNHGTLTNMDPATDWVASQGKIALDFEGGDDSVICSRDLPDAPQWTVSVWARFASSGSGTYAALFAAKFGSVIGNGIGVNGVVPEIFLLQNDVVPALRRHTVPRSEWLHAVATYDGSTTALFLNGVAATTGAADSVPYGITNTRFAHGYASNRFVGMLDDCRAYNRVLRGSELATLALRRGIAYEPRSTTVYSVPAGGGTTVTPTTLALVLTPYAPTVTTPQTLTPTTLALTLSTFAPTVSTPILATPTTAALVLTAFEPTVATPVLCTPTTATLTLTAFEPTVTAGGSITVTPTTATLTLTAFAPTVSTPVLATPTTATLVLTAYAPTVSTPQTVTPTTLALTLSTFTPTVTGVAPITVTPTTATLVLTAYPPTVSTVTADQIWTINLSLTGRRTATDLAVTTTASCLVVTAARSTAFACQYNDAVPAIAAGYGFLVEADGDYLVNSDGDYLIASV